MKQYEYASIGCACLIAWHIFEYIFEVRAIEVIWGCLCLATACFIGYFFCVALGSVFCLLLGGC